MSRKSNPVEVEHIIKIRSRQNVPAWLTSEPSALDSWFLFIDGASLPTPHHVKVIQFFWNHRQI
jgi:hypothetical protein